MIIDLQNYFGGQQIYNKVELSSKIINSMQIDGEVILSTKETINCRLSGLYGLLDSLVEYWNWDPKRITIETCNIFEHNEKYNIVTVFFNSSYYQNYKNRKITHKKWNKEKYYGMFTARPDAGRLYGHYKNTNFKHRSMSLTSFQEDFMNIDIHTYYLQFLRESNLRHSEAKSIIKHHSDIDKLRNPPIVEILSLNDDNLWSNVYKKIGVEIIFETDQTDNQVMITEKILRCILYKRPFMVVAGKNYLKILKEIHKDPLKFIKNDKFGLFGGIDLPHGKDLIVDAYKKVKVSTFEHVIPNYYDDLSGTSRIDAVFDILNELIESNKIKNIVDQCHNDVEMNYESLIAHFETYNDIETALESYKQMVDNSC